MPLHSCGVVLQSVSKFTGFLQATSTKGAATTSDSTPTSKRKRNAPVKEQNDCNGQPKVTFYVASSFPSFV